MQVLDRLNARIGAQCDRVLPVGAQRSTFLPQVWESLPESRQFLAQLKIKAGLPADFWSPEVKLWRYQVEKWKE